MNKPLTAKQLTPATVAFELDGQPVEAFDGESILNAAERHGVVIPRLCHSDPLRPDGNCRVCVVEVAGERALAPSCCRSVTPGMKVLAQSLRASGTPTFVVGNQMFAGAVGYEALKEAIAQARAGKK